MLYHVMSARAESASSPHRRNALVRGYWVGLRSKSGVRLSSRRESRHTSRAEEPWHVGTALRGRRQAPIHS